MTYPILRSLIESTSTMQPVNFQSYYDVAQWLKQVAQPWLQATDNNKLAAYRGVKDFTYDKAPLGWVAAPRVDRRSDMLGNKMTTLMNAVYAKEGLSIRRNNSLFVSNDRWQAGQYGVEIVIVIPIGEFEMAYSPDIYDIVDLDSYAENLVHGLLRGESERADEYLHQLQTYTDGNAELSPALIDTTAELLKLQTDPSGWYNKGLKLRDREREAAIKCSYYYAIERELYETNLRDRLKST